MELGNDQAKLASVAGRLEVLALTSGRPRLESQLLQLNILTCRTGVILEMKFYRMGLPWLPGPNWKCQLSQTSKMLPSFTHLFIHPFSHSFNKCFLRVYVPGTKVMWLYIWC